MSALASIDGAGSHRAAKSKSDAERDRKVESGDTQPSHRQFDTFSNSQRIFVRGLWKHQKKLISSVAPEEIVRPKPGRDDLDNLFQCSAARRMSRSVVNLFEVVNVEQGYRKPVAASFRAY